MATLRSNTYLAWSEGRVKAGRTFDSEGVPDALLNHWLDQGVVEVIDGDEPAVDEPVEDVDDQPQVVHVGGGWYELPNGERVQGKEDALAALAELD